jgi:glyoxylase-like metal-dependent hydrolase (beta-lactamase superfamily II)
MRIGPYEVSVIETGRFGLDGGAMFGVVPKPLWAKAVAPDERNRIPMAARALLLRGGGRTILVDTGNGAKFPDKLREIYKIDTTGSDLLSSLRAEGVQPADVTDVLLTHLHFDHAGGSSVRDNGRLLPQFPAAAYYVQRDQWDAALGPTERDRASYFPDDFLPLREHGVLHLLDGEGEIFPGIQLKLFHGHTTALQTPLLSDGRTTLLFCADLIPMAPHVQLPWIMAYDLRPLVTLEEKRRILHAATEEGWILVFEHDPQVAAATIRRGDKGFEIREQLRLDVHAGIDPLPGKE